MANAIKFYFFKAIELLINNYFPFLWKYSVEKPLSNSSRIADNE